MFLKGPLSGLRQLLGTDNPLNIMKNAFYFTLRALFILNGSIRKISLISKFMTLKPGKQTIFNTHIAQYLTK